MLYYAQILQKDTASSLALGLDTQEAAVVLHGIETPTASQDTLLEVADTADDTEQPTLGEILKVVNKCTASVNTLKDHFVGLWGGVSAAPGSPRNQGAYHSYCLNQQAIHLHPFWHAFLQRSKRCHMSTVLKPMLVRAHPIVFHQGDYKSLDLISC